METTEFVVAFTLTYSIIGAILSEVVDCPPESTLLFMVWWPLVVTGIIACVVAEAVGKALNALALKI